MRRSDGATGLGLSLRETPQSVSVITRAVIDDFKLGSVNDVLDLTTGVSVERPETDRSYYTARGFDIVNFEFDGIGLPMLFGLVQGDMDTVVYDRIEVLRGATGLLSGVGNPSATVNFVRKRPTGRLQASAGLTLGSWNDRRLQADVAGPLAADGSVRARLVAAAEDKDSYLDRYHLSKSVLYGVLEADLGPRTLLTLGSSLQKNQPQGNMWGALPLLYTDGSRTDYDVSTNSSPSWTYWNTDTATTFAELRHDFGAGWQGTATLSYKRATERAKLFYVYGTPDRSTGLGLHAYPSLYDMDNRQAQVALRASGPFTLAGRRHELVLGVSNARSWTLEHSVYGEGVGNDVPDFATWNGAYAEPVFDIEGGGSEIVDRQRSLFAATRLQIGDRDRLLLGLNYTFLSTAGSSYGAASDRSSHKATPYLGLVHELTPEVSVYGSYAAIYLPQSQLDAKLQRLAPAAGRNLELGVKAELFQRRLNASAALFDARQNNLASNGVYDAAHNLTVYEGVDTRSRGIEFDLAGALTPTLRLGGGLTLLNIEDGAGNDARSFSPRRTLHLVGSWQALPALRLGATLNWRSKTWHDDGSQTVTQGAYALLGLSARWELNRHLAATLKLDNVGDKKYLTSLYWSQGYYGAPRNGSLSLDWTL